MKTSSALQAAAACVFSLWLSAASVGCQNDDEGPVRVAREFASAAQRGDVKAMLPLLEQSVVESLEAAAERASDQVGGRRSIEPREMLQVVAAEPDFAIASAELLDNDGTIAHVELVGPEEQRHRVELVFQEGQWRVRVPVPVGSVRESS